MTLCVPLVAIGFHYEYGINRDKSLAGQQQESVLHMILSKVGDADRAEYNFFLEGIRIPVIVICNHTFVQQTFKVL